MFQNPAWKKLYGMRDLTEGLSSGMNDRSERMKVKGKTALARDQKKSLNSG
jgi:hypothetical protein